MKKSNGFTLIELVISVTIMGILSLAAAAIISVEVDLSFYCVYIAGNIWGWFYTPNWNKVKMNVANMPLMNIDSMRSVAQDQGRYYNGNYTVNHLITPWCFWSNPANYDEDANIIFVEGNLTFPWYNVLSYGIFAVMGNVSFKGINQISGVVYMPNPTSISQVSSNWFALLPSVYGGIFGNHILLAHFLVR